MDKFALIRFSKRTGKVDTTLEAQGGAMLKMWALHNTTPAKETLVFNARTGEVIIRVEGNKDFPKIHKENLGNIEDVCSGILGLFKGE